MMSPTLAEMETSFAVMAVISFPLINRLVTSLNYRSCATLRSRLRLTTSLKSIALLLMLYLAPTVAIVCTSPAFGELGKPVMLLCKLDHFKSAHWYNAIRRNESPVATWKENNSKTGKGLSSGQYDLTDNGNLVIRNATVADETIYRVIVLDDANNHFTADIHLVIYANIDEAVPKVNVCGDVGFCLLVNPINVSVICSVQNVRPAASLTWSMVHPKSSMTVDGNINDTTSQGLFSTYNSLTITTTKQSHFQIHVCELALQLSTSRTNRAVVFVENTSPISPDRTMKSEYHDRLARINLGCSSKTVRYAIWKRRSGFETYDTIAYLAMGESEVLRSGYALTARGHLIVKKFSVNDEGDYVCIYVEEHDEEDKEQQRFHRIKTLQMTKNQHPDIIGCFDEPNCTFITKKATGFLTCHLAGVRPMNQLEWHVDTPALTKVIEMNPSEPDMKNYDPFYDIYQTVHYKFLSYQPITEVNVSCHVRYPNHDGYRTQAKIIFTAEEGEHTLPGEQSPEVHVNQQGNIILEVLLVVFVGCLTCMVAMFVICQRKKNQHGPTDVCHPGVIYTRPANDPGVSSDITQL